MILLRVTLFRLHLYLYNSQLLSIQSYKLFKVRLKR